MQAARPRPFVVWWIKRDMRIADNQALCGAMEAARRQGAQLVALWLLEPEDIASPDFHVRRMRFVRECLADLAQDLALRGVPLAIAKGSAVGPERAGVFERLSSTGLLREVHSHQETGTLWTYARDLRMASLLREKGVGWTQVPTNGVIRRLDSRDGWKARYAARMAAPLLSAPIGFHQGPACARLAFAEFMAGAAQCGVRIHAVKDANGQLGVLAEQAAKGSQKGGEALAHALLRGFAGTLRSRRYASNISNPTTAASTGSRLSPYLAFGCISSRQVHAFLNGLEFQCSDIAAFRSRIAWRCHFIQKHEDFPELEDREVNAALAGLREPMNAAELCAWEEGTTGLPLIDASLRSVRATGFLNFRMRAMLMSFATHLLLRDWRTPAWSLARAFLDYEPGIHFGQVQMQASVTGINTVRIYCPLVQARRYDPKAVFIRKWVPELREAQTEAILGASGLDSASSTHAGYPAPIINVVAARERARVFLYAKMKEDGVRAAAGEVWRKLGSRESSLHARLRGKDLSAQLGKKSRSRKRQETSTAPVQTLFDDASEGDS